MSRRGLLAISEVELERRQREEKGKAGRFYGPLHSPPQAPGLPEWSHREHLRGEREVLGEYITGHPLDHLSPATLAGSASTRDVIDGEDGQWLTLVGVVFEADVRKTKSGNSMARFVLEDRDGTAPMIQFGAQADEIANGQVARIRGVVDSWGESSQLKVVNYEMLEQW